MEKSYAKLKKLSEKNGTVEFQAEIPLEVINQKSEEALAEAAQDFEMPGFRKGKVPKEIVRQNISEIRLLDSAADSALYDAVGEIVADEKLETLGSPELTVTKLEPGAPVEFKIKLALVPEINLPDYRKIGREISTKEKPAEATEKEVNEALQQVAKMYAGQAKEEGKAPEINDEFAKKVGPFATLAELKTEIKKQLSEEKGIAQREEKRDEMISEIIKQSGLKIPELLVDQEVHHLSHDREDELQKLGITYEEYLKQLGKTAEEVEKNDRKLVEDQLKTSIIFKEIREKEGIRASSEEMNEEVSHLKFYYPDRTEESLRRTAEAMILQRKLFSILEGEDKATPEPAAKEEA
jgi:FKBP-type peptidyl-prolyl cis-trans isomerase (trigger factor)